MLHPVGPLPASIYWRRRVAAVVATVVGITLVLWGAVTVTGGTGPGQSAQQSALSTSTPATTPDATSPAAGTSDPTNPAAASTSSGGAPATATTQPTASPTAPSVPNAVPPPAAPASGPPPGCPDTAIKLTAQPAQPTFPAGSQPVFRILITNAGATACTRDLDAALQQVLVFSADGKKRLWSSNDCFPAKTADVPTLAPGEQKVFSVRWAGTVSEPTCKAERTPVAPGSYTVVVGLGPMMSPPAPFSLT